MQYLQDFLNNRILIAALVAWAIAQAIKAILYTIVNREFKFERLVGSGGMPSSHAATVCALTTAVAMQFGLGSFEFAISFVLSSVVLHDARGVRLETGKQAKMINSITRFIEKSYHADVFPEEELKELVGHTPLQVLVGAILGFIIGLIMG